MDKELVTAYLREYHRKYYHPNIFLHYPETKFFPAYINHHFKQAKIVLDLGFGSGLWFWASFLPALERIDGIDLYPEALEEANRVLDLDQVPAGYVAAHKRIGQIFTTGDLKQLVQKGANFAFQDYRRPWPPSILQTRYELVTEHGGGLGQMNGEAEVVAVLEKVSRVLKPAGYFLFMNFDTPPSNLERKLGQTPPPDWSLQPEMFKEAIDRAGLKMVDFHVLTAPDAEEIESFFYGYAQKQERHS